MRKNFGPKTWLYPMPVLIVAAYDEDGNPNAMNAAWGGIYDTNQVMVCLDDGHKTTQNIQESGAFTVNIADAAHVTEADFVGLVSGNNLPDKLQKAGLTAVHSEFVNAPIIAEFPMAVECKLLKFNEDGICIGEIVNVSVDETAVTADGRIDVEKLDPITYDSPNHHYRRLGDVVGNAFSDGKKLKD